MPHNPKPTEARPAANAADSGWVLDALEADQLVEARRVPLGRRKLSRTTLILLWLLRAYVVFMLVVIGVQLHRTLG